MQFKERKNSHHNIPLSIYIFSYLIGLMVRLDFVVLVSYINIIFPSLSVLEIRNRVFVEWLYDLVGTISNMLFTFGCKMEILIGSFDTFSSSQNLRVYFT